MKKEEQLSKKISELIKLTKEGKLNWRVLMQTTEYNEESSKPTVEEAGKTWIVDECYVCYECKYQNEDFVLITYEMIHTAGKDVQTTNLIFTPPLGIRYFDIGVLLPYSVEASNILIYDVHTLWQLIVELHKKNDKNIDLKVESRELTIEE